MFNTCDSAIRNFLLVERDSRHSDAVRQALIESGVAGRLHRVVGTAEAVAYLRRDAPYFAAPLPNFVLLGHGIRYCDSDSLIKEVRRNPRLQQVRVLEIVDTVETYSRDEDDADCVQLAQLGDAVSSHSSSF